MILLAKSKEQRAKSKKVRYDLLALSSMLFALYLITSVVSAEVIDKVVAVVNDEIITQSDVDKALAPVSAQYTQIYSGEELYQKLDQAEKEVINNLIEDKLILAEAKSMGIEISDDHVEQKIEELREQFSRNPDGFETTLFEQGLSIADLEDNYREQAMIRRIINYQVRAKTVVKPTEVVDYYYAHLDDFTNPEEVRFSQILIKFKNDADVQGAYQRAGDVLTLLQEGADFARIVREYSDGPRANSGGSMGFVSRGEMIEEIDEVIFELKVGKLSDLIKTDLGYHIIRVEDKRSSYLKDLAEVQPEIEGILFRQMMEKNFSEWLDKLKENAYISIK